ncbi:glycoside hydrolase family 32 protein [Haloferula sp. A504]|uniref:glycoside hydrolase family 32 protein n=1 Tax=Haloferula sp. A504 TaxID=3373601 RepID=UPI0031C60F92|nr:glycoside hydrolase family 32 protein [Verrucomicrobiaceae bacterium E54]
MRDILLASLLLSSPVPAIAAEPIPLGDFDGADYGEWTTTGDAFGTAPTDGCASSSAGGDAATGTLTSPPFTIQRGYLNFLIKGGNFPATLNVQLLVDGEVVRQTSGNHNEKQFWFSWDVLDLKGRSTTIVVNDRRAEKDWGSITVDRFEQSDTRRGLDELYRPQFHITPQWNHLNDPNGLVYYDGEYHVFHQWSPFGRTHGNKCWGHLVSRDLIHWQHLPAALTPIKGWGTSGAEAWSGCAVVDEHNTAGFQTGAEKPIVLIWTAIGFGQCIAYSNDRGRTFTMFDGNPVIPQVRDDRDPMVRWSDSINRWVMALPEQENRTMGIHVSKDLKNWERVDTIPSVGDCPDFYQLPVDGNTSDRRWILHGAHGVYRFGSVDGAKFDFDQKQPTHHLWLGHQYASQTFANTPDGRRIMTVWVVHNDEEPPGLPFSQMLSFPTEIKLRTFPEGVRAAATPVKEIQLLHQATHAWEDLTVRPGENLLRDLRGMLFEIRAEFEIGDASEFGFRIRGDHVVSYKVKEKQAQVGGKVSKGNQWPMPPDRNRVKMQILVDRSLIEAFFDEGRAYLMTSFFPQQDNQSLELFSTGGETRLISLDVHELKSAWDRPQSNDANRHR